MGNAINYKIWTVCMIQNGNKVLLLDRQHDHFKGFIPRGQSCIPESIVETSYRSIHKHWGVKQLCPLLNRNVFH